MHPNYRGLAFLLSLGSLPIACNKGDNETDSTSGSSGTGPATNTGTGADATDPTATAATTGPDATTTAGPTGGMDTGTTTSTTTPTTSATTGPTTGDETGVQPPATDPTCVAWAAHMVECSPRYARYQESYAQQCEFQKSYALRTDGQACADAFDAVYVCLSMAACAELEEPGTCGTEQNNIPAACPSFDDEEPGTDTVIETGVST